MLIYSRGKSFSTSDTIMIFMPCRSLTSKLVSLTFVAALIAGCSLARPETALTDKGVRFLLHAPQAKKIAIAGDFNHWDRSKNLLVGPDEQGDWSKTISLPEGRYEYLFLIDGKEWVADPATPDVDDGLGGRNSVIFVTKRE